MFEPSESIEIRQYLAALHEVVSTLVAKVAALESSGGGTGGGVIGGGAPGNGMLGAGLDMSEFQRDLPDIAMPNGDADGDILVWDAATSEWVPTQPSVPGEPEEGEGALMGWEWDPVNSKWVKTYYTTTLVDVVTDVEWHSDTKELKQTKTQMRVIATDDPAAENIMSAGTVDAVTGMAYDTGTHQFTQTKTPIYIFGYDDAESPELVFEAEPCDEGEGQEISYTDPYTGQTRTVTVQKMSSEE